MSEQLVRDAFHAIEVRPESVGLTHAKILRNEVTRLRKAEASAVMRGKVIADRATLSVIPARYRVEPTTAEASSLAIAVCASLANMIADLRTERP